MAAVNMIGAVSPAARPSPRIDPVRIPGRAAGRMTLPDGLPLGRPQPQGGLAEGGRNLAQRLLRAAPMTVGRIRQAQGQGAGQDARCRSPRKPTNRARPKRPKTTEGTPARFWMPSRTTVRNLALPGVLGEVDGRGHAQGQGHQPRPQGQVDGPQNGREDAALGHGVLGRLGQKVPVDGRDPLEKEVEERIPPRAATTSRVAEPEQPRRPRLDGPAFSGRRWFPGS